MKARTDVHRPSAITPADYEFVCIEQARIDSLGDCQALQEERRRLREHQERTGATYSRHAHGGNCHVCGNVNAIYTALFHHLPSNTYVRMGEDCAAKCYDGNEFGFRRIRDAVTAAEFARAGKLKAQGVLEQAGLSAAWAIYLSTYEQGEPRDSGTVRDIVAKLVQYGSLSDKQIDFLRTLVDRVASSADVEAARAAEREAAKPAPTGRLTVTAEVVSTKVLESDYGSRAVMTIKAADGWLAWGTKPAGIERGQTITMTARFEPSHNDTKFAFFKRPTIKEVA